MNDTAVNIGGFFARMARADLTDGVDKLLEGTGGMLDFDAAAEADADVIGDENLWLQSHINADGQLDLFEQALLDFLAEG